jgi:NADH dehydrogenase
VVGEAAVRALVARGHTVRIVARHADDAAQRWPHGVEPRVGDVTDAASLAGAADDCDAIVHLVGIVDESPPDVTFERVNVEGTRNVVAEAERAGAPRLVYVSSLGADRGTSDYHRSKLAGEAIVRGYQGPWLIVRPGNVYGPGDQQISLLLKMVRALPAIPVITGKRAFQPIWADDLGHALGAAVERDEIVAYALDVAGPDCTTMGDLLDRFERLTNRSPLRIPLPSAIAGLGLRLGQALGLDVPLNDSQLTMIDEGNVVEPPEANALATTLGVEPTPLDEGLRRLLDALPEQLPDDGVGALHRKRFWADIRGATIGAPALFAHFCERFQEMTPEHMDLEAEPNAPTSVLACGQTVTMALPMRGNVQVRVAELGPTLLTLQTVEGHPLAGAVRFTLDALDDDAVRFQVELFDRAANVVDWLAMVAVGERLQNASWREIVENVVAESGGTAPDGVQSDEQTLEGGEAGQVERWLQSVALDRARTANA